MMDVYSGHIADILQNTMKKKTLREAQTLRAGCIKAEPKIPAQP